MNLLQNIKWNERSYPLDIHVYSCCQSVEGIWECATNITTSVLYQSQRVEYLIDSIPYSYNIFQFEIGLVRNNINNMSHNFEAAAGVLVEVDP